jgi:hypothetical protein
MPSATMPAASMPAATVPAATVPATAMPLGVARRCRSENERDHEKQNCC